LLWQERRGRLKVREVLPEGGNSREAFLLSVYLSNGTLIRLSERLAFDTPFSWHFPQLENLCAKCICVRNAF
jgi:hypothetical protein